MSIAIIAMSLVLTPLLPGQCWQPVNGFAHTFQGPGIPQFPLAFAMDLDGNLALGGTFGGRRPVDFDPTDGVDLRTGDEDLWVTRLAADGSYLWTYSIGDRDVDGPVGALAVAFAPVSGDLFIAGGFGGTVDFDATDDTDIHTDASGSGSRCVTMILADGSYGWTRSFDGNASLQAIAVDMDGNVLLAGLYGGSVDFDPGPSIDLHTSMSADYYVTKLGSKGEYLWTRTFGGSSFDYAVGVKTNLFGDVFVMGRFRFGADFDPGPGVDFHSAPSFPESFSLSRYTAEGTYLGTHVWPAGSGIAFDEFDNLYVTGGFGDAWDVDPTAGVDIRPGPAAFITKFDAQGNYVWTRTLKGEGGYVTTAPPAVHDEHVYVAGTYTALVDLDPGPGIELHDSGHYNQWDGYLITLNTDGNYLGSRVWAQEHFIDIADLAVGPDGGLILVGDFHTRVDLDPSCAVEERTTVLEGRFEPFIMKLECVEPSADSDSDGGVDLRDVAAFQSCFTGPPTEGNPLICDTGCPSLDLTPNDALDLADFAEIIPLLTGPQ